MTGRATPHTTDFTIKHLANGDFEVIPPQIADGDGVDLAAWLCTINGIPADWPNAQPIDCNGQAVADGGMPLGDPFHIQGVAHERA